MGINDMTGMERVLAALGHREPDRVPLMLLLSLYGAKECGVPIRDYFGDPALVAHTQVAMCRKYRNDVLYGFQYAAVEMQAWGGDVIWYDDGPPNAAAPVLSGEADIRRLAVPAVSAHPATGRVLEAIRRMKASVGTGMPIVGVVMSPFSLPVMQMGFEAYLRLLYRQPELFDRLMEVNAAFCIQWANAQLDAGATAICWFDPLASPTIIERATWLRTGYRVARKTMPLIRGPVAMHLASGRVLPVLEDIVSLRPAMVGFSAEDSPAAMKALAAQRVSLLGNLNALDMVRWTPDQVEERIKALIGSAARNGGFVLSDQHGEIPWQVPEQTLLAISDTIDKWGRYPLDWLRDTHEA